MCIHWEINQTMCCTTSEKSPEKSVMVSDYRGYAKYYDNFCTKNLNLKFYIEKGNIIRKIW